MKFRITAMVLCFCTVLLFFGCKEAPETSIIKDKDFSQMIEDAQMSVDGSHTSDDNQIVKPEELVGKYETYKTTIVEETLGVTVNVDAKVNIPDIEKMSVLRVSQQEITQELTDKVIAEFFGDKQLCDGSKTKTKTKSDIEAQIRRVRESIEEATRNGNSELVKRMQDSLANLEALYENTPDDIDYADFPHDGKLKSVSEEYKKNPNDPYYSWLYTLAPNGSAVCAVSDGKDGCFDTLLIYNTEDYANQIMYTKRYDDYDGLGLMQYLTNGKTPIAGENTSDANSTLKLSKEEAVAQAEETLNNLGITGFDLFSGGKYIDTVYDDYYTYYGEGFNNTTSKRQSYYILSYIRKIDGAFVLDGETKFADSWQGNQYSKRVWPDEKIEFCINDNGIVGFSYIAPIKITETVVDNSSIKSFEKIKETFEKMMPITYASTKEYRTISIDTVSFGYVRISEKDSFDTGLLVPVWDFIGPSLYPDKPDVPEKETYMTINGIDGSIIDRQLGY